MWGVAIATAVVIFKFYPLWKAKWNDARKIERDADADLRGDLLVRIRELEASRDAEPMRIDTAILAERRRCDAELAEMRRDFNQRIEQLMRIISQNSKSTAQFLGDPESFGEPRG